jgi:type II secretory pathway component GspD/PulD (secretin)
MLTDSRGRMDSMLVALRSATPRAVVAPVAPIVVGGPTEVELAHLDSAGATMLLQALYPSGGFGGSSSVRWAVLGRRSRVLLSGDSAQVAGARAALLTADQPVEHVLLEALVVQVDRETLEELAFALDQGATGSVSDAAVAFGSLTNPAITFSSLLGAGRTQQFRAAVDALEAREMAYVLARPFLSTQSGDPARISIGRDRYIVTGSPAGFGNLGSQQVQTGTILDLRPLVVGDSQVVVMVDVEQSTFVPTEGNEAVQVNRAQANSRVRVRTGETILIGGLALDSDVRFQSGLPWIARIPLVGALFGSRGRERVGRELLILITPHIWRPGMAMPAAK